MRVAIVTESFLPQVNGVTNSVLRVLEHLAAQGAAAIVIAPESAGGPDEYRGFPIVRVPAIPIHQILPVGLPFALPAKRLEYILRGFNPDVIHLASPFALGAYAARVARRLDLPTLSIYQTDMAGFAKHYGFALAHASIKRWVARLHQNTGRTLAPSLAAVQELIGVGVENVHLWRRGVNSSLFNPEKRDEQLRQSWGAPNKTIVGFVGRLANEKRISDLSALAGDSRLQIVIVGEGPAMARLRKELPTAIFAGFQSGEELARHYASFDLFIHTGPNETFCQAVQEALASGVACIVPTTGGPADLVTIGATGYVINTADPMELAIAVEDFLSRGDRAEMQSLARDSVVTRSWQAINSQLMNHYQEVITAHRLKNERRVA